MNFTLDGQPEEQNPAKPLKIVQSNKENLKAPKSIKTTSSAIKVASKTNVKPQQTNINQKKTNRSIPTISKKNDLQEKQQEKQQEKDSSSDSEIEYNKKEQKDEKPKIEEVITRQPRSFQPLSQQFPNLLKSLSEPAPLDLQDLDEEKLGEENSEEEDDASSSVSFKFQKMEDEEDIPFDIQPPIPLEHPKKQEQTQQKVDKIVKDNNKKYSVSKAERQRAAEEEKERLRKKREIMKKYGKEQIVRAHNYEQQFEQKYSWGYDQTRQKKETQKRKELEEFRNDLKEIKKSLPKKKMNISEYFPEAQGQESEFKKKWEEEGIKATKKTIQTKSVERVEQRKLKEINQKQVKKKIENNAKQHLEEIKTMSLKQKQELLLKKHKINYVDREAKEILKRTKKREFKPKEDFKNKMVRSEKSVTIEEGPESNKRYFNVNDELLLDEQEYQEYHQKEVGDAGKVLNDRELERVKQKNEKNKQKIDQINKKSKNIKLKQGDKLNQNEYKVKQMLESEGTLMKEQIPIAVHELGDIIFQDADIPDLGGGPPMQNNEITFKTQVEYMIKQQLQQQKQKKRVQAQKEKIDIQSNLEEIPPPADLLKNNRKKTNNSKTQSAKFYDVDPDKIDEDIYNVEHIADFNIIPKLSQRVRPFENSSDDEDETEYVTKSGFYRQKSKQNTQKEEPAIIPYSQPAKKRSKSVKFKEDNEEFTKPLQQMQKIQKIVKKQQTFLSQFCLDRQKIKMSKHTSDDDSDFQMEGPTNWKEHESLNKDVFLMSAKELMNMPHLDI